MEILGNNGLEDLGDQETSLIPSVTKVFVNGIWVGVHRDPKAVIDIASATLPSEVSYIYDITKQEIRLYAKALLSSFLACRMLVVAHVLSSRWTKILRN